MPDKKISDLVDGGSPQNTDEFVVARAGDNFKLAWSSLSSSQSVQTQNAVDVSVSGNTAGVPALVSSGTLSLAGGNNITLSQVGNAVTISGAAIPAESQTFIAAISASNTVYTSGSVRFTGSQAITVRSGTGQLVVIDAPAQSVQPETQTFVAGISASDTLYTSGNVRLTGVGGGVTISSNTGQRVDISVAAQSVQPETQTFIGGVSASDTLYTSGTVRISGVGGGITVSSNTGQRIDLSVAAQSVQPETQTFVAGISASDTLYTSGNVRLTGSNAVTVKSGTGQLVVIDVPTQTTQAETQTFIGGVSASDTLYTSGSVRFTGSNMVTVKSGTGQLVVLDATQSVQTQDVLSVGASTGGNTSGNTGVATGSRLVFVGSNNITVSQGTAAGATTLTISGPATSAQQTGISAISNSNTTYVSGTVGLSELGAITIRSTTGQQFQFSVNSQTVQTQNLHNVTLSGNTAGALAAISSGTLTLAGGNNITLSQAGNAVTISGGGAAQVTLADWQNYPIGLGVSTIVMTAISKTPFYWNDIIPGGITAKSLVIRLAQVTGNSDVSFSVHLGVYTRVNSTSAALLGSLSEAFHVSSGSSASFTGARNYAITGIGTHATLSTLSGGEYMFGMMMSATATNAMNFGLFQASIAQAPIGVVYPGTNNLSAGTSQGAMAMWGRGSTTVDSMPANVQASELMNQGAGASMQIHPWIYIRS